MDKCQFCGAKVKKRGNIWIFFECNTTENVDIHSGMLYGTFDRSKECLETELTAARQRIAELEDYIDILETTLGVALATKREKRLQEAEGLANEVRFYL